MDLDRPSKRSADRTRAVILEAAAQRFLACGYEGAGLRAIGAAAGVDPALVSRHFGSKCALFHCVIHEDAKGLLPDYGDRAAFGRAVADALVASKASHPRVRRLRIIIRSLGSPVALGVIRRDPSIGSASSVAAWLGGGASADLRARMIAALVLGGAVTCELAGTARAAACGPGFADRLARDLQQLVEG